MSRWLPSILAGIAVVVLFSSFLLPSYATSWPRVSVSQAFYLTTEEVQSSVSTNSGAQYFSYSTVGMPGIGSLYTDVSILILVAVVLGVLVGVVTLPRSRLARSRLPVLIAVLGIAFAVSGPIGLALTQPSVACEDAQHFPTPTSMPFVAGANASTTTCSWWVYDGSGGAWTGGLAPGPQTTFFGPTSPNVDGFQWGPAIGWWLPFVAGAFLAGAALSTRR